MSDLSNLRRAVREIFDGALRAVDPREAVRSAVQLDDSDLKVFKTVIDISSRRLYVIAIGKAANAMARGLDEALGNKIVKGVIAAPAIPATSSFDPVRWQAFVGGHPLPNQQSLDAARTAFELLQQADNERALVIFLVSGGGSATIEWPCDEQITLEDLRETNRQLISCGASIAEINAVRRAFSAVKGGGLAARAPRAEQISLIVSDTNSGDEASVASGPSMVPPDDAPEANRVVNRYQLDLSLPASVLRVVRAQVNAKLPPGIEGRSEAYVLLNNQAALESAANIARQLGFEVEIANDICEQPIGDGCYLLLSRLQGLFERNGKGLSPVCLISGGEFSCPVAGSGIGGRNLETALRCAVHMEKSDRIDSRHTVILSAGTDGIDGNSPAAGAIADENSLSRARTLGLDAQSLLERSDSFTFFEKLNDVITTGPTGTNVRDLRIFMAAR